MDQQVTTASNSDTIKKLLAQLYPDFHSEKLLHRVRQIFRPTSNNGATQPDSVERADEVFLITYADSIISSFPDSHLETLSKVLRTHLKDTFSALHLLPFFPYTSDDGFAVSDYDQVNPSVGTWQDIEQLANSYTLMFDAVINHVSSSHPWFQDFVHHPTKKNKELFLFADPDFAAHNVTRPRNSPLFSNIQTSDGPKALWTTFSADQIDLNYQSPELLLRILKVLDHYLQRGASYLRLDAVAFLWKESGTTCMHLRQVHLIVQLIRALIEGSDHSAYLITETNVPHDENIAYFGNSNEAHLVYNFSLPPLLLHAMYNDNPNTLAKWLINLSPPPQGCAYFNFLSSHDGIGLRPVEKFLGSDSINELAQSCIKAGGAISARRNATNTLSPYELNISWWDAMGMHKQDPGQNQEDRFIFSHALMLSMAGVPAIYILSLFATKNDEERFLKTGQKRALNRHQWKIEDLNKELLDTNSHASRCSNQLKKLIECRRTQPAFAPNSGQIITLITDHLLLITRTSVLKKQTIFSLYNFSNKPITVNPFQLPFASAEPLVDLLQGMPHSKSSNLELGSYGFLWLSAYD